MECGSAAAILVVLAFIYYWMIRARNAEVAHQRAQEQDGREAEHRNKRDQARRSRVQARHTQEDLWAARLGYRERCPAEYVTLRGAETEAWDKAYSADDEEMRKAAQALSDAYDARILAWFRSQPAADQEIWRVEEQAAHAQRRKAVREQMAAMPALDSFEMERAAARLHLELERLRGWLDAAKERVRLLAGGLEDDIDIFVGLDDLVRIGDVDPCEVRIVPLLYRHLDQRSGRTTSMTPAEALRRRLDSEAVTMVEEHVRCAVMRKLDYDPWG